MTARVDLGDYVRLEDESNEPLPLRDGDVYLSKSSQLVLGIQPGDTAHVQDSSLNVAKVKVSDISLNYLGNTLYMTQGTYERAFGRSARLNGVFVLLKGSSADQIAFSRILRVTVGLRFRVRPSIGRTTRRTLRLSIRS